MKSTSLWMLATAAALIASCSKSDSTPKPDTSREDLKVNLTGKWTVPTSVLEQLIPTTASTGTDEAPASSTTTFVEFFADSTYVVAYTNYPIAYGKYVTVSGDSINIDGFGFAGGIRFNGNKIDFRLTEEDSKRTVPVTTTKEPVLATDERTGNINQKWYILKEENWQESYPETADSINVRFSNYGTMVMEGYKDKGLAMLQVNNWKWHATESGKFQIYNQRDLNAPPAVMTVRELSKTSLKISQWYEWDNTHPGDDEMKLNMRPAK
ncbi:hypothetical protein HHL16_15320 [Pseudoflavitalea sp. G-6-1-2]|uniref:hypothetical protein n=1 Tax=Pseudoflavitalea sp. G-6-1-2 TaxID=2728841 RepID=UPI00146EDE07|nr:hypothetical protein [Pseudoflavitalea sp. G-6-1-2]NML22253.1 hypothetical protein [Pseudoflavitalea sp. G-6-1-2]